MELALASHLGPNQLSQNEINGVQFSLFYMALSRQCVNLPLLKLNNLVQKTVLHVSYRKQCRNDIVLHGENFWHLVVEPLAEKEKLKDVADKTKISSEISSYKMESQ